MTEVDPLLVSGSSGPSDSVRALFSNSEVARLQITNPEILFREQLGVYAEYPAGAETPFAQHSDPAWRNVLYRFASLAWTIANTGRCLYDTELEDLVYFADESAPWLAADWYFALRRAHTVAVLKIWELGWCPLCGGFAFPLRAAALPLPARLWVGLPRRCVCDQPRSYALDGMACELPEPFALTHGQVRPSGHAGSLLRIPDTGDFPSFPDFPGDADADSDAV
jgi:hypothetical protein